MKRILFFILCFIISNVFFAFAQTQAAYTNQFFVVKTGTGQDKCFVFIYEDNFTFINFSGAKVDTVKIRYNMEGLEQVFIAGNRFFIGLRGGIYYYDLSRLTNPINDGRNIDDDRSAFLGQIRNVRNVSQYGDTVFITKNGDSNVYELSPNSNEERVIDGITISPGRIFSYVQNAPRLDASREKYLTEQSAIDSMMTSIPEIANNRTVIENILSGMKENQPNSNAIYEALELHFVQASRDVVQNTNRINGYLELALVMDDLTNANSIIAPAKVSAPRVISQETITRYYASDARVANTKNELIGRFGRNYSQKNSLFTRLETDSKRQNYNWITNHSDFNSLLKDATSSYRNQDYQDYEEYIFVKSLYDHAKSNFGTHSNENIKARITDFYNQAESLQKESITSSSEKYRELNKMIIDTGNQKNTDYDAIVAWAVSKYISEEISRKIVPPNNDDYHYGFDFIDHVIVTDTEKKINGFPSDKYGRINTDGFGSNLNNNNETPLFMKPSGYPIINITKNGIFILNAKNQVIAFDNSSTLITKNVIEPLTIEGGIFYMLNDENVQYIVSNNGDLLQLEISGNRIISRQQQGINVTGTDTVLITPEKTFLIFSDKGTVRGRTGTVNRFNIKAINAATTYSVTINNNGFLVR
jgi:hypothetical protein